MSYKTSACYMGILLVASFVLGGCAERGYNVQVQLKARSASAQSTIDIRKGESAPEGIWEKMIRAVKRELLGAKNTKAVSSIRKESDKLPRGKNKIARSSVDETAPYPQPLVEDDKKQKDPFIAKETDRTEFEGSERKRGDAKMSASEYAAKLQKMIDQKEQQQKEQQRIAIQNQAEIQGIAKATTQTSQPKVIEKKNKNPQAPKRSALELRSKKHFMSDSGLKLIAMNKTFYKFGTSEIHGHVIYLDSDAQGGNLENVKVYLIPSSATVRYWFKNYYLKDRQPKESLAVSYIKKTGLDLDRNFSFFGVPEGSYVVIIVGTDMETARKVYIAKEIDVGKYKKVMVVFSKRLKSKQGD